MRLVQALRLQWRGRNPLPLGGGGCQICMAVVDLFYVYWVVSNALLIQRLK